MSDEIASLIELQHRGSWCAAHRDGWVGGGVGFTRLQRTAAVDDPDMVLRVHRDANGLAHDPVVGQGLGPQRIDLEARRGDGSGFDYRMFLEQQRSDTQRTCKCQEAETNI